MTSTPCIYLHTGTAALDTVNNYNWEVGLPLSLICARWLKSNSKSSFIYTITYKLNSVNFQTLHDVTLSDVTLFISFELIPVSRFSLF